MSLEEKMENGYRPINDGITLFCLDDFQDKGISAEAVRKLYGLQKRRPGNIVIELNMYRKYVPIVLEYIIEQAQIRDSLTKENIRMMTPKAEKSNKRWSPEEDELLIEMICRDDINMNELSIQFGRSPGAISTHVSQLVGRKRLSQEIAGKFIGFIDGIRSEADVCGTVYKE